MKKKQREAMERRLEQLDGNEKQKIYKQARKQRKLSRAGSSSRRRKTVRQWLDDDEEHDEVVRMRPSGSPSIVDIVSQIVPEDELPPDEQPGAEGAALRGTVVTVNAGHCRVRTPAGEERECRLAEAIAMTQKASLAVGDDVLFSDETGRVESVLPRRTLLSRPDPGGKRVDGAILERAIVANVDAVVIVTSLKTPPFRVRLVDRYLVAIERSGATPVICVNKTDLGTTDELEVLQGQLEPYQEIQVPCVLTSAVGDSGVGELAGLLQGKLCAFVGHSGVGKSSLIRRMLGDDRVEVGHVNSTTGRGRHTTTTSHLHDLGNDTSVIDTPGVRSFGLNRMTPAELAWAFPEFESFGCKYRDCTHSHEPECSVRAAAEDGRIPRRRFETYLSLLEDMRAP